MVYCDQIGAIREKCECDIIKMISSFQLQVMTPPTLLSYILSVPIKHRHRHRCASSSMRVRLGVAANHRRHLTILLCKRNAKSPCQSGEVQGGSASMLMSSGLKGSTQRRDWL